MACTLGSIWEYHNAKSLLNAPFPETHVNTPICPLHRAKAISLVFVIGAGIDVSGLPLKDTLAVFLIKVVLPFVRVATCPFFICERLALPLAMTVL
jgi:hypothetical protein